MSREKFEAWIKPLWHLETFEGNDNSLLYRDEVIQGKWEAWQAASKESEQQLAALAANNALLKDVLLEEGYRYFDAETEVTDAYLAEVRAHGVEMFSSHLRTNDRGASVCKMIALGADEFAAQLRKGVQS
ncbi:hypothetical protein [Kluyvera cryocrescens]|uniref:hypothetical protein n=1 Tax=Kluyvera cryocrescens TaxID=580 RepID=UPI000DD3BA8C|nr:hypothetical protein [Kluyvera cryocrescens]